MAHRVPLVGLAELSHGIDGQHIAEDECLHLLTGHRQDVGQQQFRRESKHLPDRS